MEDGAGLGPALLDPPGLSAPLEPELLPVAPPVPEGPPEPPAEAGAVGCATGALKPPLPPPGITEPGAAAPVPLDGALWLTDAADGVDTAD